MSIQPTELGNGWWAQLVGRWKLLLTVPVSPGPLQGRRRTQQTILATEDNNSFPASHPPEAVRSPSALEWWGGMSCHAGSREQHTVCPWQRVLSPLLCSHDLPLSPSGGLIFYPAEISSFLNCFRSILSQSLLNKSG